MNQPTIETETAQAETPVIVIRPEHLRDLPKPQAEAPTTTIQVGGIGGFLIGLAVLVVVVAVVAIVVAFGGVALVGLIVLGPIALLIGWVQDKINARRDRKIREMRRQQRGL